MILRVLVATALSAWPAQDEPPRKPLRLPEVPAYRISDDRCLLFTMRVEKAHFEYLEGIRRLEAAPPLAELPPPVLPDILKRPAPAFGTELSYFESDWLNHEDLETAAALLHRMEKTLGDLLGPIKARKRRYLITHTQEAYYEVVDHLAGDDERTKKTARLVHSLPVGDTRVSSEPNPEEAFSVIVTDLVMTWSPPSIAAPTPLREGIHIYLSALLTGEFHYVVSLKETSPLGARKGKVGLLISRAREVFSRPKREPLETVLKSEINALSVDRLSVLFALVDYLLRTKRDRFPDLVRMLEKESHEGDKLKGPEGLIQAQKKALVDVLGFSVEELDAKLKEFVAREYLLEEEIARALGIDRESSDTIFEGFEKVCQLRREGKPVSEKGDRIYQEIVERVKRKLAAKKVPF